MTADFIVNIYLVICTFVYLVILLLLYPRPIQTLRLDFKREFKMMVISLFYILGVTITSTYIRAEYENFIDSSVHQKLIDETYGVHK